MSISQRLLQMVQRALRDGHEAEERRTAHETNKTDKCMCQYRLFLERWLPAPFFTTTNPNQLLKAFEHIACIDLERYTTS